MANSSQSQNEILLQCGAYRALTSTQGASLRRLWLETPQGPRDILWGYSGTENKKGGQGDVLIPFPGRIPGGRYSFQGREFTLEKNDKEGPNAIHGFVRNREWAARASDSGVSFRIKLMASEMEAKGYPFSLDIGVSYSLSLSGLRCEFSIQNIGDRDAPVAAGFHPYFLSPAAEPHSAPNLQISHMLLQLPASQLIEFAPGFIPTGRILPVAGTELDFTKERPLGNTVINNCFTGLARNSDGQAQAILRDPVSGSSTRIGWSEGLDYLVVYTGEALGPDARRAVAIEPMSCGTDAFNRPIWGLKTLPPLSFFTGSWSVAAD